MVYQKRVMHPNIESFGATSGEMSGNINIHHEKYRGKSLSEEIRNLCGVESTPASNAAPVPLSAHFTRPWRMLRTPCFAKFSMDCEKRS
jgi:hypothetical protein